MQILFLISYYHISGGHENVLENLGNGLSKLGHHIAIGAFHFEKSPPSMIDSLHLSRLKKIPKYLNSGHPIDIIHSHHTKMNYYSLVDSRPFIFHSHGASNKLQEINLRMSMLLCRDRISKIIYISNYAMSHVRRVAGSSSLAVPSEVIYNGVDTKFFNKDLPHPYKKGEPQFLFVGNLYRHKNVKRILKEMPNILRVFPNAHLQIVGSGTDYFEIKEEIINRNLNQVVEMVGSITNDELRLRYSSCDIYISSSKNEDFGVPLLEAMACGKPVLVSNIPSHNEIVRASCAGRTFCLDDVHGIENELIKLIDRKYEYGISALRFAKANDWSNVCMKIARIYDELAITSR